MHTKLLTLLLLIFLSGCFTNDAGQVTVVEKSFNKIESEQQQTKSKTSKSNVSNNWSLPIDSTVLKNYSEKDNHFGLTYNNSAGQEVRAIRKGEVVYSGDKMTSYGKMIIIKHAYGFYSIYNQNQELLVSEGDIIEKGGLIALTSDKPFYFEMKKYEEPINPLKYL
jgi:lipoprotein NlpD|tara:strand:- start:24 stop:521 length:498 start_codon:yes stop_codon:yes gene_type:complete